MSHNLIIFSGGPFDGIELPCIVNPGKILITCHPDDVGVVRAYLYECDSEHEHNDRSITYYLTQIKIDKESIDEIVSDMESGGNLI